MPKGIYDRRGRGKYRRHNAHFMRLSPPELDTQGMRIRRLMRDRRILDKTVYTKAKIDKITFSRIVNDYTKAGRRAPVRPSEEVLRRIARVIGCTYAEIFVEAEPRKFTLKNVLNSPKLLMEFLNVPAMPQKYRLWVLQTLRLVYTETKNRENWLKTVANRHANAPLLPKAKEILTERYNMTVPQLEALIRQGFAKWQQELDDTVHQLRFPKDTP